MFKSNFTDFYDGYRDPSVTYEWNRETRYSTYGEELPGILSNFRKRQKERRDTDTNVFNPEMLVLGIYPDLYFFPIKKNLIQKTYDYEYFLTTSTDWLLYNQSIGQKDRFKVLKELGIDYCSDRFGRVSIPNQIGVPNYLSQLGIPFDEKSELFKSEYHGLFKYLGTPIFVTDLYFKDFRCNPKLSKISLNLSYWDNKRSNFIELTLPVKFRNYIAPIIWDKIGEFFTSGNEVEEKPISDRVKIESHGFSYRDSFRKSKEQ